MCTKKTLYQAGHSPHIVLSTRKRGEKLDFNQISFTTECVRMYANHRNIPMVEAIGELRNIGAFPIIYKAARSTTSVSSKSVVKKISEMYKEQ